MIGGGPAGLSAALFTGKSGLQTAVFDTNETWMHKAHLFNYPGIGSVDGSVFMNRLREQVDYFDVERHQEAEVTAIGSRPDGFVVETAITTRATISSSLRARIATSPRTTAVHLLKPVPSMERYQWRHPSMTAMRRAPWFGKKSGRR